jgi:hypothetical protein
MPRPRAISACRCRTSRSAQVQPDWVVVEASSFQLADIDTFAPAIGVVTNFLEGSPRSLPHGRGLLCGQGAPVPERHVHERLGAERGRCGGKKNAWGGGWSPSCLPRQYLAPRAGGGRLDRCRRRSVPPRRRHGTRLLHHTELRVPGAHNRANALAAAVAAFSAGAPVRPSRKACARSPVWSIVSRSWPMPVACSGSTTPRRRTSRPRRWPCAL